MCSQKYYQINNKTNKFTTNKKTNKLQIGLKDIANDNNVLFSDYVKYIINTYHECYHVAQFDAIKHSEIISQYVKDFAIEYDNQHYYEQNYHQSSLELDAQYLATIKSRKYLNDKYPGHENDIDNHILYWNKLWCENPYQNHKIYIDQNNAQTLDDFLTEYTTYKTTYLTTEKPFQYTQPTNDKIYHTINNHKTIDRPHSYDICFEKAKNLRQQKDSAFLITIENNTKLSNLVPIIKNKKQIDTIQNQINQLASELSNNIEKTIKQETFQP